MRLATTHLFVYGSLKVGYWNHRLIEAWVHDWREGTIQGVLVNLGCIPALVPGDGLVRGDLLTVDEDAIVLTDRLEGHHPDCNFYRRKRISVTLADGHTVDAWVYEYATPTAIVHLPRLLVGRKDKIAIYAWSGD